VRSKLTLCISVIASLLLASCNGMQSIRVDPSCQLSPPDRTLLQHCPVQWAPEVSDSKGGTLLLNHNDARATYDECRVTHDGLVAWAVDATARCVKAK
jgi:hypothetical protein